MTTPAQSVDVNLRQNIIVPFVSRYPNGTVYSSGNLGFDVVKSAVRQIRPASSTSPVRADGSRAPKPWSHSWGLCEPIMRSFTYVGPDANFPGILTATLTGSSPALGGPASFDTLGELAKAGDCLWIGGFSSFPMSIRNAAITKLRLKVIDDKAQWGVTLGEMKQTISGIRSVSEDIINLVSRLARSVKRSKRDTITFLTKGYWPERKARPWSAARRQRVEKQVTGRWLEWQFAVVPTLMDIEQSAEALSWLLFDQNIPMRFSQRAGQKGTRTRTWVTPWPTGYTPTQYAECHTPLVIEEFCHFSVVYSLEPTTTTTFQQLGLTNVAGVAWELTQLSWMVDYISTVGDWLNSMVEIDGLYDVELSESLLARVKSDPGQDVQFQPRFPGGKLSGFSGVRPLYEVGRFQRLVSNTLPGPALLPSVRNKLTLTKMANVLSVLSQMASAK